MICVDGLSTSEDKVTQVYINNEDYVNEWLKKHNNSVEIVDIKFAVGGEHDPLAMVIYREALPKEDEVTAEAGETDLVAKYKWFKETVALKCMTYRLYNSTKPLFLHITPMAYEQLIEAIKYVNPASEETVTMFNGLNILINDQTIERFNDDMGVSG